MHTHALVLISMYNAHPCFSLKNLGKKVCIIHGKIRYMHNSWTQSKGELLEGRGYWAEAGKGGKIGTTVIALSMQYTF